MNAGHDGRDKSQLCSPYPFILLGKYYFSFPVPKVIIRYWSSRTSYFYGKKKYARPISLTPTFTLCSSLNEFRPKAAHQVLSTPLNGIQWASEREAGQRVLAVEKKSLSKSDGDPVCGLTGHAALCLELLTSPTGLCTSGIDKHLLNTGWTMFEQLEFANYTCTQFEHLNL